jgi:hypothetical protein
MVEFLEHAEDIFQSHLPGKANVESNCKDNVQSNCKDNL